jgi:hypothetical protein
MGAAWIPSGLLYLSEQSDNPRDYDRDSAADDSPTPRIPSEPYRIKSAHDDRCCDKFSHRSGPLGMRIHPTGL